ncbi:unnamed protein product [Brassicogethes aeneus]|uniref:lysozyme n=1 Tax=Brassicogethes aeneus TaxID=1431903 RepID=A0A9P0FMM7_BRAAE|nr:unnamed protein product [Brassicogethes aeneus]
MNMLKFIFAIFFFITLVQADETSDNECVVCMCHALTSCWSLHSCARESISYDYWKETLEEGENDSNETFEKCMEHDQCLTKTVLKSTSRYNEFDTNCDKVFDCRDRFAIHLFANQKNVSIGDYAERFWNCLGYKEDFPEHYC